MMIDPVINKSINHTSVFTRGRRARSSAQPLRARRAPAFASHMALSSQGLVRGFRTCPQIGRPCVVTTKRWMLGASRSLGLGPRQGLQRRRRALSSQPYGPGPYGAHAGVATRLWCAAPRRDSLLRLRPIGTRRRAFLFADKFLVGAGPLPSRLSAPSGGSERSERAGGHLSAAAGSSGRHAPTISPRPR